MALKKKIPQTSGVEPDYFKLDKLFVNPGTKEIQVTFAGYLNAAARTADKAPVAGADVTMVFKGEDYDTLTAEDEFPTKSGIYSLTKTVEGPLQGATNSQ